MTPAPIQEAFDPQAFPSWLEGLRPGTAIYPRPELNPDGPYEIKGSQEELLRDVMLLHRLLPVLNELLEAIDVGQATSSEIGQAYCRDAQQGYKAFVARLGSNECLKSSIPISWSDERIKGTEVRR